MGKNIKVSLHGYMYNVGLKNKVSELTTKMEVLMSNWSNVVQSLPEKYVFPPEKRPGKDVFPVVNDVPVINLETAEGHGRGEIIHQILHACQQFGFFQVINHGIPESRMDDTMNVLKEFFGMSAEYKAGFYSMDIRRKCRIYSSSLNYDNEEVHYWRDNFTHYCFPLKDHLLELWPEKPIRYREVVSAYSVEVRKLMLRILDLIREGLGLKLGYFEGELTQNQLLSVNYHIPCPNPSLTLGMPQHCDPNLISMLHQCSVPGLQVLHRGQWMTVDPMPNAFVLNLGLQFKVISNGKFASPIHRVITHREEGRTTIATFLIPADDTFIQPPNKNHAGDDAPLYRCFTYKEFYSTFNKNVSDPDFALEYFKNSTK